MKQLILFLLILYSPLIYAQSDLILAKTYFDEMKYELALPLYKKALAKKSTLEITERIADCYRLNYNNKEAERWYAKALGFPHFSPINVYYYAEALRSSAKYKEAALQYKFYARLAPAEAEKVNDLAVFCEIAQKWINEPLPVKIVNEKSLNTKSSDWGPVFFNKGLILTSDRKSGSGRKDDVYGWTGRSYLKLFYSIVRTSGGTQTWGKPKAMEAPLNSNFHNAGASLPSKQNIIYFTRTNRIKKLKTESKKTSNDDFVNRCEIYSAEYKSGKWINVTPFIYNNPTRYSIQHPAVTSDGKRLYFSSDMPGGFGKADLYYCDKLSDNTWSKPVNCGALVNTSGAEGFPAIVDDSLLYFSSDGHMGLGGLDIFVSTGSGSTWSVPSNLRYPLNSPRDDFGILFNKDKKSGFLSSDREGGLGSDDIYQFLEYIPSEHSTDKTARKKL